MKRGVLLPALLGTLLLGQAAAQDLGAYRRMATALDTAVTVRASDDAASRAASLAQLDRAATAYTELKASLKSSLLTSGIERGLETARAALGRTPADLEAQVVQVRGLMRKALHDQTLTQIGAAPQSAAVPAQLLATEFGLSGQNRAEFLKVAGQGQAMQAARLLRVAAARKVQSSLNGAGQPPNGAGLVQTYLALARASGWFVVVQDAPDTGGLTLGQFGSALTQLTDPTLSASLSTLKREALSFVQVSERAAQPGSRPAPAVTLPARPPSGTSPSGTPPPAAPANRPPTIPVPSPGASGSTDPVYAALGRALTAAGHADTPTARLALTEAGQLLGGSSLSSSGGFAALSADVSALAQRSGLRASDVQAVIAELANLEGNKQSALDASSVGTARVWPPIWALLFLAVGLLAGYPLYLLNLAFGGRNAYWRAIAAALVLLFVPVLLEGVSGTLHFLGDLSGLEALRSAGNLSLYQGAWGQPLWLLLSGLAVALSSYGFRGLCRQFGLLGGDKKRDEERVRDTRQSALDWDEDI